MSLEKLVSDGAVHPFRATPQEVARVMDIARRDLAEAQKIMADSLDWSFSIAYNAVLQACRAYMFHLGYRPASSEAHKTTFEFMRLAADPAIKEAIEYFDRVRKKRHRVIYDEVGLVSEKEAQQLVEKAKEFLSYVEGSLQENKRPGDQR